MLHVTNGDSVVGSLEKSGIPGRFIAWRDVLHEGPVPAGMGVADLRRVRAEFLAERYGRSHEAILAEFSRRDLELDQAGEDSEVVLWFEHDLYDQLQLIEILDRLSRHEALQSRSSLICIGSFPGVTRFTGLGVLTPEELASLFPTRRPIAEEQFLLAQRAWSAFRAPAPLGLVDLLHADTSALPFLPLAVRRLLEEYPAVENGLSRTEAMILDQLAKKAASLPILWVESQMREEALFMGDNTYFLYAEGLTKGARPLARWVGKSISNAGRPRPSARILEITDTGRAVLSGEADAIHLNGIDRWYGGVHLTGSEAEWRWAKETASLVRRP